MYKLLVAVPSQKTDIARVTVEANISREEDAVEVYKEACLLADHEWASGYHLIVTLFHEDDNHGWVSTREYDPATRVEEYA